MRDADQTRACPSIAKLCVLVWLFQIGSSPQYGDGCGGCVLAALGVFGSRTRQLHRQAVLCWRRRPPRSILNNMSHGTAVIQIDPEIMSGTPVFAGTRLPVQTLLEHLERGQSLAEFLTEFPSVTQEQAIAVLEEAKDALLARARRPAQAAADLLESWLEEDSTVEGGLESWEQLKRNLDSDRSSSRPLFP